ncbi:MAG: hypothetical protein QOG23_3134 [Blastocatellia bacterium]|jgi:DNA-directed RNA polymerase specialized sigma24 family protein|nr:hypothetical protein [Blastocatellia bacterium]
MSKEKSQLRDREFELLLTWLDPDPDRGAEAYLSFHKRLMSFFTNRNCCGPEDLAYETLDRVARQLADGKQIRLDDRRPYLHGVAKFIVLEHWRTCQDCKRRRRTAVDENGEESLDSLPSAGSQSETEEGKQKAQRLQCLDDCLLEMIAEERWLLLEYYSEDKTLKIVTRERIATRLGLTSGALRQRLCKLRTSLRHCVLECTAG